MAATPSAGWGRGVECECAWDADAHTFDAATAAEVAAAAYEEAASAMAVSRLPTGGGGGSVAVCINL